MTKEEIIQIVCNVCEISPADLKVRSRKEPLPTARALIAHFLYRELRMSPREIRPLIGHPSYSRVSIYRYIGKQTMIDRMSPFNKDLRDKVSKTQKYIDLLK